MSVNISRYDVKYNRSIEKWYEALPIGNGRMGCLIYGDGPIHFALDTTDLWDENANPVTAESGFNYRNLISLVRDGGDAAWEEHSRLFDKIYLTPNPTKLSGGIMDLDFGVKTKDIVSEVSLKTAIATVKFGDVCIESFMSATRFVGVAKIYGDFEINIVPIKYISKKERGKVLDYPQGEITDDGEIIRYIQTTRTDFSYGIVVLRRRFEDHTELYFTLENNKRDADFVESAVKLLKSISAEGYESLKKEHVGWWRRYWKKSSLSVGDELFEKTYYRSYYLFASCSRKGFAPMPLQGVWTDPEVIPNCKGDYHHDTNTQMSYQSYLKANRLDEGRAFVDYLWDLRGEFRKFAKEFYGVNGYLLPGVSSLDGKPLGGWPQYALSPTMTIWSIQSFDEYYLYTGSKTFLKERAYPIFKWVGEAIAGLLEERDGKLYLPLSTSPEIFDNRRESYLTPNSNYDLALVKYLFITLKKYSIELGKDATAYEDILSRLEDFHTDGGELLLAPDTPLRESHRHFSHLMCLYPLHLINYDTPENRRLYDRSMHNIEKFGTGSWMGFSYPMCAQIYAMMGAGNGAYEKLREFAHGFVSDNGFGMINDFKNYGYTMNHRPLFEADVSFGFCDALQEMLLQEHEGYINLFPALPIEWKNNKLSFTKFRSYGGVLVSAKYAQGRVMSLELYSKDSVKIKIKNRFGVEEFGFSNGVRISAKENDIFDIEFKGKIKLLTY